MNQIWTDGSSSIATGQCGWAFVGIVEDKKIAAFGHLPGTNQVAELTAIKYALLTVPMGEKVVILTDSQYSINCMTLYREAWESSGFISSSGKPVKNRAIVEALWGLCDSRGVELKHVRGHKGNPGNELADVISKIARRIAEGRVTVCEANTKIRKIAELDLLVYVGVEGPIFLLKEDVIENKETPKRCKKTKS